MSARNPVGWFEIYVTDMARARAFYEGVLDVTMTSLVEPGGGGTSMWAFPMAQEAAGAAGALVAMQGGQRPNGNGTLVYFTCQDCAVEAARVPAQGGTIVKDKFAIGEYGFVALVADPDGNVIGLHSRA
ncbi:MAG: VOC family protein [Vicinamibacterales bacterium]